MIFHWFFLSIFWLHSPPIPPQYHDPIVWACHDTGAPIALVAAIIEVESGWDCSAISGPNVDGTYDAGLMQENSAYIDELWARYLPGVEPNPLDGKQSIIVGVRLLKHLFVKYGSWDLAAIHYNGSERYLLRIVVVLCEK